MTPERILIVGTGEAGLSAVATLRELGCAAEIVMVGDEPRLPYQRPPLSKEFLTGDVTSESLDLRTPEFFREHRIDLRIGHAVVGASVSERGGVGVLDDRSEITFDGLLLATGSRPRRLRIPGADLAGVATLRTHEDALALRQSLDTAKDVVIVGGGFIGLEVAATARTSGATVTVVEAGDRLMSRVVAAPMSDFVTKHHVEQGIRILTNSSVTGFRGSDDRVVGVGVTTDDGSHQVLTADLVVVGVGAVANIDLANDLGLVCDRGIVVDECACTSHPRVFAAGDCTVTSHPHGLDQMLAIESVNNAVEQGKAAARSLLGLPPEPRGIPWFWSNQGALKIQIAGISDGYDSTVVRCDGDSRLTVLYYRQGRLIAADSVNNPRDHMAARRALNLGQTIDPDRAADAGVALKVLVTDES